MTSACPTCAQSMSGGWVAMWNPIVGQKVRWQAEEPGYLRLRIPASARVVLRARAGGKDARQAWRCASCATVVIPPDPSYDA